MGPHLHPGVIKPGRPFPSQSSSKPLATPFPAASSASESHSSAFPPNPWNGAALKTVQFRKNVKPKSFQARDNVSNFIDWCRHQIHIREVLLFETEDLVLQKNEKNVILCIMEVARRGAKFGMSAPQLIQLEEEIEREML